MDSKGKSRTILFVFKQKLQGRQAVNLAAEREKIHALEYAAQRSVTWWISSSMAGRAALEDEGSQMHKGKHARKRDRQKQRKSYTSMSNSVKEQTYETVWPWL